MTATQFPRRFRLDEVFIAKNGILIVAFAVEQRKPSSAGKGMVFPGGQKSTWSSGFSLGFRGFVWMPFLSSSRRKDRASERWLAEIIDLDHGATSIGSYGRWRCHNARWSEGTLPLAASNRRIAKIIRACQELPGQELLQYIDEEGRQQDVTSSDVNGYSREITG
jgi:hypothetical protein